MQQIYLDNAATTQVSKTVVDAMNYALCHAWGNPSSLHEKGQEAATILRQSKNEIYVSLFGEDARQFLSNKPNLKNRKNYGQIIFTSGGTESNNLAVFGIANHLDKEKTRIITTNSEHPSIIKPFEQLKENGYDVVFLGTKNGVIDEQEFLSSLNPNTKFISIMHVNNETGAIYPLKKLFSTAKSVAKNVICHADCVQSFQKLPLDLFDMQVDMLTISGHKIHAPKGIGALWVSDEIVKKNRLKPILLGGGQQEDLRSGTENLQAIYALSAAVKENGGANASVDFLQKVENLKQVLLENLPKNVKINTPCENHAPHIVSLLLPVQKSQPILNFLSNEGIYVSSGSACSSKSDTISKTLLSFGLSRNSADATIRVSFDKANTIDEVLHFCRVLEIACKKIGCQN